MTPAPDPAHVGLEPSDGKRGGSMSAGPASPARRTLDAIRTFGLAGLWVLTAAWMVQDAVRDPYDPLLEGTRAYGHNGKGALLFGLGISVVEVVVLHVVVQPWRKGGSAWGRLLVMLLVLVPWALSSAVLSMHAGGIVAIHVLWLFVVVAVLAVSLVVSVVGAIARARRGEG